MTTRAAPGFEFSIPGGYDWLLERGIVGFAANTALQPWHYLPADQVFDVAARWPGGPSSARLVAFAKRQDCDDLACFDVEGDRARRVVQIHGWTGDGYAITATFEGFWDWMKRVIDDIADWSEQTDK